MKYFLLLTAGFFWGSGLFAVENQPAFDWSLLWSGSWEDSKTIHNRGEIKLNFLPPGITLRGAVLDKHTMNFELDPPLGDPWGDPEKGITNFTGGLYHKSTGSRLLFGVIDEWGLSARIRNPWIRSAPYAENHKPLMADLKTAASSTKEDEAYLYLSSPIMNLFSDVKLRSFVSAQASLAEFTPAVSGGLDFSFAKKYSLLFEVFYTGAVLPPSKTSTWFSNQPFLPEREFRLYAMGLLFSSPLFSVSSDFAFSETFAWGTDIYCNMGISVAPLLPIGRRARPLSISFAMDGAGQRFVYRDGADHGAGFRSAGKIEWKGIRNSLFRINSSMRGPEFGKDFNHSSSGIYYRFPDANRSGPHVQFTRISLSVDRNAENPLKISDRLSGNFGIYINMPQMTRIGAFRVNFAGSIKGLTASNGSPSPYPVPGEPWVFDNATSSCELIWSRRIFQFKAKLGYSAYEKKDDKWDFSLSGAVRFKYGRLSLKAESPGFPEKWIFTVSWRLEKK